METIEFVFRDCGIGSYGCCALKDVLPLLPCKSAKLVDDRFQTVISCVFPYPGDSIPKGNLSVYACVPDYHAVIMERLDSACEKLRTEYPQEVFLPFVDSSPIREVRAAVLSGLGVLGKNGLLLTKDYGSYVFLGEIVTSLKLRCPPAFLPECSACGACERACPGKALADGSLDEKRCVSYLTQKKGELTVGERELIRKNGLAWGCDRCQEVCPYNRGKLLPSIPEFCVDVVSGVTPETASKLCETRAFGYRGAKVILRNLDILSSPEKPEKNGGCNVDF